MIGEDRLTRTKRRLPAREVLALISLEAPENSANADGGGAVGSGIDQGNAHGVGLGSSGERSGILSIAKGYRESQPRADVAGVAERDSRMGSGCLRWSWSTATLSSSGSCGVRRAAAWRPRLSAPRRSSSRATLCTVLLGWRTERDHVCFELPCKRPARASLLLRHGSQ